jgi:hypothetical protein
VNLVDDSGAVTVDANTAQNLTVNSVSVNLGCSNNNGINLGGGRNTAETKSGQCAAF